MRILILLAMLATATPALANEPGEVLDAYFNILTSRDFATIAQMMDEDDMARLKSMMDVAMKAEADRGVYQLQERVFGERVDMETIESTTAEFYLEEIAGEILTAANRSHFFVDDWHLIGSVAETDEVVHYVVRLDMSQDGKTSQEIFVYTLVLHGEDWQLKFPPTIKQIITSLEASTNIR